MQTRLVQPTDFQLLAALADGYRDTASNLAVRIEKDRNYVNTRLPALADADLIQRIGPNEHSGLYQITPRGVVAVQHQSIYETDRDRFEALLDQRASAVTIEPPAIEITGSASTQ